MAAARRGGAASPLLALASLTLSLGLAELLLRGFYPVGRLPYRIAPELLFELAPGTSRAFLHHPQDGGGFVVSRVNSVGLRGPELRERTGRRVVVYGDSFVHAEYSPHAETFAHQLELQLGDAVEVVNAGVRAYGPDQALLHFARTREPLAPDAVVFAVYAGNDFGDLIRNKLFRPDRRGGLRRNRPSLDPGLLAIFHQNPLERLALAGLYRVAKRGLKLRRGAQPVAARFEASALLERCRRELESYRADDIARADVFEDHYDADLALEPDGEAAAEKRRLMRGVLARLAQQAGELPVLVLAIPAALDLAPGLGGLAIPSQRWPDYDPRRLTRSVVEAARAAGLPVIDLWDDFQPDAHELYYARNRHWNARGQALAARRVAAELARRLPQSRQPEG
jgi:lysophospholipase L1-like esterase